MGANLQHRHNDDAREASKAVRHGKYPNGRRYHWQHCREPEEPAPQLAVVRERLDDHHRERLGHDERLRRGDGGTDGEEEWLEGRGSVDGRLQGEHGIEGEADDGQSRGRDEIADVGQLSASAYTWLRAVFGRGWRVSTAGQLEGPMPGNLGKARYVCQAVLARAVLECGHPCSNRQMIECSQEGSRRDDTCYAM